MDTIAEHKTLYFVVDKRLDNPKLITKVIMHAIYSGLTISIIGLMNITTVMYSIYGCLQWQKTNSCRNVCDSSV